MLDITPLLAHPWEVLPFGTHNLQKGPDDWSQITLNLGSASYLIEE